MNALQGNTSRSRSAQKSLDARLFKAIREESDENVRAALESGADANATSRGWSALGRACRSMRHENGYKAGRIVARLMAATGTVPDHRIAWWEVAKGLLVLGEGDALRRLLDGADEPERKRRVDFVRALLANGMTSWWPGDAIEQLMRRVAPALFSTVGDAVERVTSRGTRWGQEECQSTWLHLAVADLKYCARCGSSFSDGSPHLLDHLLTLKPPLEMRWFGMTPLHLAALSGYRHAFAALLNAGADPNAEDGHGRVMGRDYGRLTDEDVAALDAHRLHESMPSAVPAARRRF